MRDNEFQILAVESDEQGWVTVSWCGASNVVYQIQAASDMLTNTLWEAQALIVGEGYSSWTDTNAPALEHRFYRCRALPGDEDADSDGLPNMAEFNLGTDLDDPDSDGDGIADGDEVNVYGTDPLNPDSDNDFWLDGVEVAAGYSATNAASFPVFSFTINGGADVVTNAQVQLSFPGLIADYVIISEAITMAGGVTNSFASPLTYTLANTNDGLHTIFVQWLKSPSTLSPVFGRTVELDTHPPTLTITSPSNGVTVASRRVNIEGFASDAATNAPAFDASRPLQVTVSGDFVNDRDTNGVWWSGLHDLAAGTNRFTAVATDRAGFSVTNSVWFLYDPSLATNVPVFTVDVTNTIVVGSNAMTIAVSGTIDDDNATIEIALVDATDDTITNATVRQIVYGYDMLSGRMEGGWVWTHSQDDCFYARHYPDQHRYRGDGYETDWWDETRFSYWYQDHDYSYSGVALGSYQGSGSFDYSHDEIPFGFDSGWATYSRNDQFRHVDASRYNFVYDCPYPEGHDCECENPPYCEGEDTSNCCIDTHEARFEYDFGRHAITFVKHWPTDEEQTVILHLDKFYYWLNSICGVGSECYGTDASKIRLWGQAGFEYSTDFAVVGRERGVYPQAQDQHPLHDPRHRLLGARLRH